eukprot:CAMPEP_0180768868 /NCGR_PEP_ID=MMETSP1038_2-20121128/40799_1 /TAXON_ID=632150 /ORGANISM="Azadinium spinosum, Strain 3D9" /LENGTH=260 /DNA_ID=CAMNT_0022803557 /DNA_START=67 /DNA_END=845 /DNA_ORIENTATION=-
MALAHMSASSDTAASSICAGRQLVVRILMVGHLLHRGAACHKHVDDRDDEAQVEEGQVLAVLLVDNNEEIHSDAEGVLKNHLLESLHCPDVHFHRVQHDRLVCRAQAEDARDGQPHEDGGERPLRKDGNVSALSSLRMVLRRLDSIEPESQQGQWREGQDEREGQAAKDADIFAFGVCTSEHHVSLVKGSLAQQIGARDEREACQPVIVSCRIFVADDFQQLREKVEQLHQLKQPDEALEQRVPVLPCPGLGRAGVHGAA